MPLEYESPNDRGGPRPTVIWIAAVPLIALMALFLSLPLFSDRTDRGMAEPVRCAANLRNIGLASLTYARNFGGRFPERMEDLILVEEVSGEAFVCRTIHDTPVTGTLAEQAAALSSGGHCSYVYVGKGFTLTMCDPGGFAAGRLTSDIVLAYENPGHHKGGMNVLFVDGHVQFVAATSVAQLFARYPPPVAPATRAAAKL